LCGSNNNTCGRSFIPDGLNLDDRKIAKIKAARLDNLILVVSNRLALSEETAKELDVLWFAGRLPAADVVERADLLAGKTRFILQPLAY
jgi:predicted nuclease of restriction endonuclease-like RecB superfamily